ncbi:MAG: GNAT family N-acetyltransferase [Chloroflexota bacterium]
MSTTNPIQVFPATPERWEDLVSLFGPRGACAGCWCMWFRLHNRDYVAAGADARRQMMAGLVAGDEPPGLLAYVDGQVAGWCAVAPRDVYERLTTSRVLAPVDEQPVWSVVCFFIDRRYRGRGLTVALLEAAVAHAHARGARMVEGYPVEPRGDRLAPAFAYHGLATAFRRAGFAEVARRSPTRPIMRYQV